MKRRAPATVHTLHFPRARGLGDSALGSSSFTRRIGTGAVCLCNCLAHLTLAGTPKGTPTRDQTHNPEYQCLTGRVRPTWGY